MSEAFSCLRGFAESLASSWRGAPLPTATADALGCVLAVDVVAPCAVPRRACSRLDGFAVVAGEGAGEAEVVSLHRAGCGGAHAPPPAAAPAPGTRRAAWVTTGAPLPTWADAVVGVEDTAECGGGGGRRRVALLVAVPRGHGVRAPGSDVAAGVVLLRRGHRLAASDVAALLLARVPTVLASAEPLVGLVSSGDELVDAPGVGDGGAGGADAGADPDDAVWDSNAPMLEGLLLSSAGGGGGGAPRVLRCGRVRDDAGATLQCLASAALRCQVVVTTGAVSMGDRDFIKPSLERLCAGAEVALGGVSGARCVSSGAIAFGRLAMKPGKPTTAALLHFSHAPGAPPFHSAVVLALPGNPVSAWVCAQVLLLPLVRALRGEPWDAAFPPRVAVEVEGALPLDPERPEFHRAAVWWAAPGGGGGGVPGGDAVWGAPPPGGRLCAASTGAQASSRLASTTLANALLCVPQGSGEVPAGERLPALLLAPVLPARPPPELFPPPAASSLRQAGVGGCGCQALPPLPQQQQQEGPPAKPAAAAAAAAAPRPPHALTTPAGAPPLRVAILTVSDSAAAGASGDASGPAALAALREFVPVADGDAAAAVVPDDVDAIQAALRGWCEGPGARDLVLTTGGTGFSRRDVTPEATAPLLERRAPGLVAAMFAAGLRSTPMAALSRYEAGMRGRTLVINLPGSPKAVRECLAAVGPCLKHALALLRGE